jgi:hypothetical protein
MPTVVGVGAGNSGTSGAVTAAFPAGYTAVGDDVALTFGECEGADVPTAPSGWAVGSTSVVSSGTTTKLYFLWRRLVAGDTAPSVASPGNHHGLRMIVVRGLVTAGNPWNGTVITSQELVADTTVSIPGMTTTSPDCLVLAAFSTGQDTASTAGATGWANASLASLTERMDNWVSSGLGGGFAMASGEKATGGVVSATTATLSLAANFKAHMAVALQGAVVTGEPPLNLMRSPRPSEQPNIAGPYAVPITTSQFFVGG